MAASGHAFQFKIRPGQSRFHSRIHPAQSASGRNRVTDIFEKRFPDSENMIFIVGCGRSGTTLLTARFGNLPNVHVMPAETECFLPPISAMERQQKFVSYFQTAKALNKLIIVEKDAQAHSLCETHQEICATRPIYRHRE